MRSLYSLHSDEQKPEKSKDIQEPLSTRYTSRYNPEKESESHSVTNNEVHVEATLPPAVLENTALSQFVAVKRKENDKYLSKLITAKYLKNVVHTYIQTSRTVLRRIIAGMLLKYFRACLYQLCKAV